MHDTYDTIDLTALPDDVSRRMHTFSTDLKKKNTSTHGQQRRTDVQTYASRKQESSWKTF